jgi:hypothetical protein
VGKAEEQLEKARNPMGFVVPQPARDFDQVRKAKLTAAVSGTYVPPANKPTRREDRIRTAHNISRHHGNVFSSDWDGNIIPAAGSDAAVFPGSLRGFKHLQSVTS